MHRTEGANNDDGKFTEGPPATVVTPEWLNSVQEELINVIEYFSLQVLTADTDTQIQLRQAIVNGIASEVAAGIAAVAEPVGTIKDWHKDMTNTPALSEYFVECNGEYIVDAASVYNGYRVPNLNNESITFSVVWVLGVATIDAVDLPALLVGNLVTGGAIPADTYIDDITGAVITLSDLTYSGTCDTTFEEINGGRYLRGGSTSGVGSLDAMQRIRGRIGSRNDTYFDNESGAISIIDGEVVSGGGIQRDTGCTAVLDFDSANSSGAKTDDDETSVLDMTVVKIMRIK